ncbi:MAG: biosynthetic-type acetolactate synthase large subunit [Clostridiales bacterium]|jgi:acetolactate synthase-1/2/3 large subunit|nr:biosynthetic-type acetolactate synthase large subunit [Clostridiales bacterium]
MTLTGARIVMECLLEQGVDTVFGLPGGAVLNIYDALYSRRSEIRHILTAHEQAAAHAADGYARAGGGVGVCLATSGPGATNLVTGIAAAYMDSVPMVAITANVPVGSLGRDSFQEVDIAGITMPVTKHNFIVRDVSRLADTLRRAFYIAREGRPGPVLVDIPNDVTAASCTYEPRRPDMPAPSAAFGEGDIAMAAELIADSKRPLIICGGGVVSGGAAAELRAFADALDAPVASSLMGLGGFPSSDRRFIGMIGMHGSQAAALAATSCDLLVAVGCRFSDRVSPRLGRFAPGARLIHIDVDRAEIGKSLRADAPIVGDARLALAALTAAAGRRSNADWVRRTTVSRARYPIGVRPDSLSPRRVLERLDAVTRGDRVIVTEVGQHQMWVCQYMAFENPRELITSGGLGAMGFGLPAAVGAKLARPGAVVAVVAGDGCFRMNNTELATVAAYDIPIVVIVMNNHSLGLVRQWQTMFMGGRHSETSIPPVTDYVKLAEAHGIAAVSASTEAGAEAAMRTAIESGRPAVVVLEISPDEKVLPMVPPGSGMDDIIVSL